VAVAVIVASPLANASNYPPLPGTVRVAALEARLPTPIMVLAWDADNSGTNALVPGTPIYLAGWATDLLLYGKPGDIDEVRQLSWAWAAYTLYHEWWHIAFHETNEQNTDLGALSVFRYALLHYWGLSVKQAQYQYELVAGEPGVTAPARTCYHPTYTPTAADPLLEVMP
jgi:hypothetical protein